MRLIDADALNFALCVKCANGEICDTCKETGCGVVEIVDSMPTIEAEPVRHGRWILCKDQTGVDNGNDNFAYFCSYCHYQDVHSTRADVKYCWNCGARMDGDKDEGD